MRAIIRYDSDMPQAKEMVEATWGSDPRFSSGVSYRFVRSEGQSFPRNRCLVPASAFEMQVEGKRYRVSLEDGNFFYLAGVWESAMAGWPLAFRIITVEASRDVLRYQERHGAIIQRRDVLHWLDGTLPESNLLVTPPSRIFDIREVGKNGAPSGSDGAAHVRFV
ncbi:SOS response-associated peptidase family protein [Sphingomonas abietis]|uniref:SOS response-associated peptidase family protein n=1 Tax=Sphingomonas abietis TaxID=3012344 RepID=A0ABY7NRQ4_9SPHN|nr:SOS response-associated peptidase family protein [Sphingomonas abietis]WBO23867.1 SOS response-associated peptidase family protein [Sphingomonas abietis]